MICSDKKYYKCHCGRIIKRTKKTEPYTMICFCGGQMFFAGEKFHCEEIFIKPKFQPKKQNIWKTSLLYMNKREFFEETYGEKPYKPETTQKGFNEQ